MNKIIPPADCFDVFLKSLSVLHQADDKALSEIKKRLYKRSCVRGKTVYQFGGRLGRFPRIALGFLKCLSKRIIHYSLSVDTIAFASTLPIESPTC